MTSPGALLELEADLDFSVSVDGKEMTGTLRGSGSDLVLHVSEPTLLGGSGTALARTLAEELAVRGLRLSVVADRPLVTLGALRSSYWQRRVTGSRHIQVASWGAAWRLLKLRRGSATATPLVPPPSPLPLLPTLMRRLHTPTTTHDPDRGGYPRLVMALPQAPLPGHRQPVFPLTVDGVTTIGSADDCDIVVPGLAPQAAEIRHTDQDEFVLAPLVRGAAVRVNGGLVKSEALLRTGSRVELGDWTLSYAREEYADHGRPYGGRIGGEAGHQRPQPPRSVLQG